MTEISHNSLADLFSSCPIYFPSVSSVKTQLAPLEYVKILLRLSNVYSYFLISAYDIANAPDGDGGTIQNYINNATSNGTKVLMDSGNYESYWKFSNWEQGEFHSILTQTSCSMAFCYDNQAPPQDIFKHKKLILSSWEKDKKHSKGNILIPIIHGLKESIPELCLYIADETQSPIVAVPERRLGDGMIERAQTVAQIRAALNKSGKYIKLHLLGTGNPISIAVYSIMGADSFDGLEWCQTVVDPETAFLFHFSQADLFWDKGSYGNEELPFILKTLVHNLEFYSDWMKNLQLAIQSDTAIEFCESRFSRNVFSKISKDLHWRKPS